ncbi:MAG: hypothetical protein L0Y76_03605 [Ignavibacteria bacterium]|nr:hypothetical protein [Ignavibacteria bacterium]
MSDAETNFWRELTPPYNNVSVKPDFYFSTFNGTSSGGNWRLLYYDAVAGDGGTFDSARLSIIRLSGTTSPCARLDFVEDSVAFFFDAPFLNDTVDFY